MWPWLRPGGWRPHSVMAPAAGDLRGALSWLLPLSSGRAVCEAGVAWPGEYDLRVGCSVFPTSELPVAYL